jgi:hypothetical protein
LEKKDYRWTKNMNYVQPHIAGHKLLKTAQSINYSPGGQSLPPGVKLRMGLWRGHCLRKLSRKSWVQIPPGCKVFTQDFKHSNAVLCNLISNALVCISVT